MSCLHTYSRVARNRDSNTAVCNLKFDFGFVSILVSNYNLCYIFSIRNRDNNLSFALCLNLCYRFTISVGFSLNGCAVLFGFLCGSSSVSLFGCNGLVTLGILFGCGCCAVCIFFYNSFAAVLVLFGSGRGSVRILNGCRCVSVFVLFGSCYCTVLFGFHFCCRAIGVCCCFGCSSG